MTAEGIRDCCTCVTRAIIPSFRPGSGRTGRGRRASVRVDRKNWNNFSKREKIPNRTPPDGAAGARLLWPNGWRATCDPGSAGVFTFNRGTAARAICRSFPEPSPPPALGKLERTDVLYCRRWLLRKNTVENHHRPATAHYRVYIRHRVLLLLLLILFRADKKPRQRSCIWWPWPCRSSQRGGPAYVLFFLLLDSLDIFFDFPLKELQNKWNLPAPLFVGVVLVVFAYCRKGIKYKIYCVV